MFFHCIYRWQITFSHLVHPCASLCTVGPFTMSYICIVNDKQDGCTADGGDERSPEVTNARLRRGADTADSKILNFYNNDNKNKWYIFFLYIV